MPQGQLTINGKDAYTEWGLSMDSSALSALMTPAPIKSLIENDSRLEHGKKMITTNGGTGCVRLASRDITLIFNITAKSDAEFLSRYSSFCEELACGTLDIGTSFQPGVVYRCVYQSCQQFSEFVLGIGKFTLRLTEPDPTDRT